MVVFFSLLNLPQQITWYFFKNFGRKLGKASAEIMQLQCYIYVTVRGRTKKTVFSITRKTSTPF